MCQPVKVKLVGITLSVDLRHDVLVVVVAQRAAELVVVHVGLVLAEPPQLGHLLRPEQLELAVVGGPADQVLVALVQQQLKQELPQGDGALHGYGQTKTIAIA